jgi:hypothetical protein
MPKVYKGVICPAISVATDEDKYLITMNVDQVEYAKPLSGRDESKLHIVASLFNHVLSRLDLSDIPTEDIHICLALPKEAFTEEVRVTCDNDLGLFFEVSDDQLSAEDEVTKFAPRLKLGGNNAEK